MNDDKLKNYLEKDIHDVKGWCVPHLWNCLEPIMQFHSSIGLNKPVAEIGVYHGKFFIGLVKSTDSTEPSHVFDVFDMQEFNLDGAGVGSRKALEHNLLVNHVSLSRVILHTIDSMTIGHSLMTEMGLHSGQFSFFSVDGCHTPEHTINDTRLAMDLTCSDGIVFVDDYNNPNWPGVQEGIAKMYLNDYPRFVPLVFTCNKLMLCHISRHQQFLELIASHVSCTFKTSRVKRVKRFGYDTLTISPDLTNGRVLSMEASTDASTDAVSEVAA